MSQQNDAEDPNEGSEDVVCEKLPVTHRTHASHKWSESANQRYEPGKHNRFGPVPFVEGVRLLQMLSIEDATLRIAEKPLTDFVPDPIIYRMAENSRDREQDKNDSQVQMTALGGQSSDRKQEGVSREKWSYYQPRLGKDDHEEQRVDPGSVSLSHLAEIKIQMQDDVQEF
jgi:hypothetical protein